MAKKAVWRRPFSLKKSKDKIREESIEDWELSKILNQSDNKRPKSPEEREEEERLENFRISRVFPRKIYLREAKELT